MKPVLRVLLMFLVGGMLAANAQDYQMPSALELQHGKKRILIPQKDKDGRPHDYYSDSCRGSIDRTMVHAVIRRKGITYVVYGCEGWSRGPEARSGRCGSGWEHQINWVALSQGTVVSFQQMDIESCWRDIYGSLYGWVGGMLTWGEEVGEKAYKGYFDPQNPERGLQREEAHKSPNANSDPQKGTSPSSPSATEGGPH